MRWNDRSLTFKILTITGLMVLVFTGALGVIAVGTRQTGELIAGQGDALKDQATHIGAQRKLTDRQSELLTQQVALTGERSAAAARLELANQLDLAFSTLSYWLTDLSLSLQTASERHAATHRTQVNALLTRLAQTNPGDAKLKELPPLIDTYVTRSMEAADAHTEDNRVRGNALSSEARLIAIAVTGKIAALKQAAAERVKEIEAKVEAITKGIQSASGEILTASHQLDQSRSKVDQAAQAVVAANRTILLTLVSTLAISLVIGLALSSWLARMMSRRIRASMQVLEQVATGDLRQRQAVSARDEIGRMAEALNHSLDAMRDSLGLIAKDAQDLSGSAQQMNAVSDRMGGNAATTAQQSANASQNALQVSDNVRNISAGIEEMQSTVSEIAKNAHDAANLATQSVREVDAAAGTVGRLHQASAEITEIIGLISAVAEQTNLLALNATIEAARAGEAGKGFAVVAGEVKALAQQTASATGNIQAKIGTIQSTSTAVVDAIRRTGETIHRINQFQTAIAAAVEEQAATTAEIARSINDAATRSAGIATAIDVVSTTAAATRTGADETRVAAGELSRLATDLLQVVGRFKV